MNLRARSLALVLSRAGVATGHHPTNIAITTMTTGSTTRHTNINNSSSCSGTRKSSGSTEFLRIQLPSLLLFNLERCTDRSQHGFVLLCFQIIELAHEQHGSLPAIETARPAGIGQVKAEES